MFMFPPRRTRAIAALFTLAVTAQWLWPSPLAAQWAEPPHRSAPRTKEGALNLHAPTPRTNRGKPDFSGIWYSADAAPGIDVPALLPADLLTEMRKAAGQPDPPPPPVDDPCAKEDCITQEPFPMDGFSMGRSLPGRALPYQPWARQLVIQRRAAMSKDDPHAVCMPPTYPRAFVFPQNWKIVQTPDLIVLLHEFNASYRQIFLDGRPLPDDPLPGWNGYSVGHWEKDTLVVETTGFRDDLWLDFVGSPLTDAAHVTERFRRTDYGTLSIEVTVNDPKAYTRPWTVVLRQRLVVDTELLDDICLENEQSRRLH
jgi:hypothetical protein